MKAEYKLNDSLNLRELIETVTEHIRTYGSAETQPRTILSFLTILLYGLPFTNGSTESWISTLQKVLSGNISYTKAEPLARQICSGQLDDNLFENLSKITTVISQMPDEHSFYQKLQQRISLRFFSEIEKRVLQELFDQNDYTSFLVELVKHSFTRLYHIPCFFAERIYEEALTYDYDSKLRFALMREAAVSGNKNAALEYGNYLTKTGPYEEAFEYLMLAIPLHPAMWNLAFLVEKRWIGHEQAKRCRLELKIEDKLSSKEFEAVIDELDGLTCLCDDPLRAEELVYVYKIYFYLANRGFYKAYNSMAKLLLTGVAGFSGETGKEKGAILWRKYLQAAIAGNNVMAMSNEGNRILLDRTEKNIYAPFSTEEKYMVELLTIGSDMEFMHSCYYLGNYYEYSLAHGQNNITRNDIKKIYERAAKLDQDGSGMGGQLYLRLGKLSDQPEEQVFYFEKALAAGLSDAAYALAMSYYEMSESTHNVRYLLKAAKLLDDNIIFMTKDISENAVALQKVITALIKKI